MVKLNQWQLPEWIRIHGLGFMLGGDVLFPAFWWPGVSAGWPRFRWEEVLLALGLFLNVIFWLMRRTAENLNVNVNSVPMIRWQGHEKRIYQTVLLWVGIILLADGYASWVLQVKWSFHDAMEFVVFTKYLLLFMAGASIPVNEKSRHILLCYLLGAFIVSFLISWAQAVNGFNINGWLTPVLAPEHLGNLTKAAIPRVLGTFGNPNMTGIFAVLVYLTAAAAFLGSRSFWWVTIAFLAFKLILMVISRTALLAMAAGLSYLFIELFAWQKGKKNHGLNFKLSRKRLILFLAGCLVLMAISPDYFFVRVNEGAHLQTSTSVSQHFELWRSAWEAIKVSPVFGWGSAKGMMTSVVDNEYLLIVRRYGLLGLGVYFLLYFRLWKLGTAGQGLLRVMVHAGIIALLVFNIGGGTWYSLQLMGMLWPAVGMLVAKERA